MGMLGYQCDPVNRCNTVNQFTFAPTGGPLFFSAAQCSNVCGGMQEGVYRPKSAFL